MVATVSGPEVIVRLECLDCRQPLTEWNGKLGLIHINLDDADGDAHEHICEK